MAFSVFYENTSLDIVCKDKREFEIWVTGIKSLSVEPQAIDENSVSGPPSREASFDDSITVKFKGKKTIVQKREDSNDVYSWGQGVNGRLGHGDENDQLVPKVIEALLGKDVRGIDCGPSHSAAWSGMLPTQRERERELERARGRERESGRAREERERERESERARGEREEREGEGERKRERESERREEREERVREKRAREKRERARRGEI